MIGNVPRIMKARDNAEDLWWVRLAWPASKEGLPFDYFRDVLFYEKEHRWLATGGFGTFTPAGEMPRLVTPRSRSL